MIVNIVNIQVQSQFLDAFIRAYCQESSKLSQGVR